MPLWEIYHPEHVFTDPAERQKLSQAVTQLYRKYDVPGFFVGVIFIKQSDATIFRSGEPQTATSERPFVRIVWTNVAGGFEPGRNAQKTEFLDDVEAALKPFVADKGYDWEHHGIDADVTLGRIEGYDLPPRSSPLWNHWLKVNKALPLPDN